MSFSRTIGKILTSPAKAIGRVFKSGNAKKPVGLAITILLIGILAGFFCYPRYWDKGVDFANAKKNQTFFKSIPNLPHFSSSPFRLGLDLQGGTHLVYEADLTGVDKANYGEAMQGVRDVIERRVNLFGVTEPLVQIDQVAGHYRLIVELAGIKDVNQAIKMIGETPSLDFRTEKPADETQAILEAQKSNQRIYEDPYFQPSSLTGRYLKNAQVDFNQNTYQPVVSLIFNDEGAKLFEELTRANVGKRVAIYLDSMPISAPTVNEAIVGGRAQISGNFTVDQAKELVRRLNAGALPVPIDLVNQQSVGASLGEDSLHRSLRAGLLGLIAVAVFMLLWYRFLGVLAVAALLVYTAIVLAIFKLIPVTLTLAGIAGFILSIGMAVDANILIFERMKEELRSGKSFGASVEEGFARAWLSIRDSNASSLITCVILFWLGTSIIKGFALTLGIGILVSLFSAIFATKTFLRLFIGGFFEKRGWMIKTKR